MLTSMCYSPSWKVFPSKPSTAISHGETLLLIGPQECEALFAAIANRYQSNSVKTIILENNKTYDAAFYIEQLIDIERLYAVYFSGGVTQLDEIENLQILDQAQTLGVLAFSQLLKALIQLGLINELTSVKVLTFDTQQVVQKDIVRPHYAGLQGLGLVIYREYPHLAVTCIDLSAKEMQKNTIALADVIVNEFTHDTPVCIAWRDHILYKRVIELSSISTFSPFTYRQQGVYLIIGGASGIGLAFSEYLASEYQAKLVWVARSSQEKYQEQIEKIKILGGEVIYCQANVSDFSAMQEVIEQANRHFGEINGAIHSALVLNDKTLLNMDSEAFNKTYSLKVQGSVVFYTVLKQQPLDFMLYFSSVFSFLGNAGQANYVAGSVFQDTWVNYLALNSPFPVKVINWGYWGSIGRAATPQYKMRMDVLGMHSIEPEEGIEAINLLLNQPIKQMLIIKAEHDLLLEMGLNDSLTTMELAGIEKEQFMLEVLNRYIHGYVAIPIILACYRNNVFDLLFQYKNLSLEELTILFEGNEGHLQVAMRLFVSIGWVRQTDQNTFEILIKPEDLDLLKQLPQSFFDMYHIVVQELIIKEEYQAILQDCLTFILKLDETENKLLKDFLRGVVIVPLLIALRNNFFMKMVHEKQLDTMPYDLREKIITLFVDYKWGERIDKGIHLTEIGYFMLDRAYNAATALSYAPMLSKVNDLLFGDAASVFKKDMEGHELHVDRTLNVIGSGFQHVRYFSDVEGIIVSIFNKLPFEDQPKYVIDTGSGDGTFLKKIYNIISTSTARGKVLTQYPLQMIGVDYNDKALAATTETLSDIPHFVLQGDIGNPQKIIDDLIKMGVHDVENSLHIRSFLDHDRPYIPPQDDIKVLMRSNFPYSGVFVELSGKAIKPSAMIQSLVEHLSRWAAIKSKHGLIILEVHCLPPKMVARFLNESENLHFDAMQAFSKQYLVEADVFLTSAAEAGLFPNIGFSKRYPQTFPYSRITLNLFEKRDYLLSYATENNVADLRQLEEKCWPARLCATEQEIHQRIANMPQGQLVLKQGDAIIAVAYLQKISNLKALQTCTYANILSLYDPEGMIIQLLGFYVDPSWQDTGIGDQFISFILLWASVAGIDKVVGVTRCRNYVDNKHLTIEQYVDNHISNPDGIDQILRFHTSRGAIIKNILYGYRSEDVDNDGVGILIEYQVQKQVESYVAPKSQLDEMQPVIIKHAEQASKSTSNDVGNLVLQCINQLLTDKDSRQINSSYALFDLGFDSLRLLELRMLLNRTFSITLDPTFFFEYNTPLAIINYINQHVNFASENSAPIVSVKDDAANDIAIIGMGCRFPGDVKNPEDFWQLLLEGKSGISAVPANRQDMLRHSLQFGGFLSNIDCFDADFFRISPREAELMDPQQRILLEVTWQALEAAGIDGDKLAGSKTGVFVGIFSHDYESILAQGKDLKDIDVYYATGNSGSVAAGRIAYFLGLAGPAMAVNTACSSSLLSVHLACKSLLQGECELALAGGVNLILAPELNFAFTNAGMLSPDGLCKTFSAAANGYGRSEGCGVVVLKKLAQARADKDNILAIIRGSVVNQDGASNGLTAPNKAAQVKLMRDALLATKIPAKSIDYLETHGTGTPLGDPIEVSAIAEVYNSEDRGDHPLILGAVKTNIGHAEAASGIAGFIKTVLMLKHKQIPMNLHMSSLNPHIHLGHNQLLLPNQTIPWQNNTDQPLRAGVNSFGFSGTNVHVILEEAPSFINEPASEIENCFHIIAISAKSEHCLRQKFTELSKWIERQKSSTSLAELGYHLNMLKSHFPVRCAMVINTVSELQKILQLLLQDDHSELPKNVFVNFNGGKLTHTFSEEELVAVWQRVGSEQNQSSKNYQHALIDLAKYYVIGYDLSWEKLHTKKYYKKLALPVYPFAKDRYWFVKANNEMRVLPPQHPLLDIDISTGNDICFMKTMYQNLFYLKDHCIGRISTLPAVVYLEMARAAVELVAHTDKIISLSDVTWNKPITFLENDTHLIAIHLMPVGGNWQFTITTDNDSEKFIYAQGMVEVGNSVGSISSKDKYNLNTIQSRCRMEIKKNALYNMFKQQDMHYGPTFQAIEKIWMGLDEALAKIFVPAELVEMESGWVLHPSLLDAVFQTALGYLLFKNSSTLKVPFLLQSIHIFNSSPINEIVYVYVKSIGNDEFNIVAMNESGQPFIVIDKIYFRLLPADGHSFVPKAAHLVSVGKSLSEKTYNYLKNIFIKILKLEASVISPDKTFENYGVDSLLVLEINKELSRIFGRLSGTLLFEYKTLSKLAKYFVDEHNEKLKSLFGADEDSSAVAIEKIEKQFVAASEAPQDVAIIGCVGRYPQANNLLEFWEVLQHGKNTITTIPAERWDWQDYYDPKPGKLGKSYSKWGGFIDDVDKFDPRFFNISPAEAERIDPQERIFLETVWALFEDAGYKLADLEKIHSKVGVYVGSMNYDYATIAQHVNNDENPTVRPAAWSVANRVSYYFNLQGPSVAVDTACSSSLTAIHFAYRSLCNNECELAIAGGVSLILTPEHYIHLCEAHMLSPSGASQSFADSADGFVPGEGIGAVLLKPLVKALADGDRIYAVIKGSAINAGGKTSGYFVPNPTAQQALIESALAQAQFDPATISYIEAHGTGTVLGDPIEISAINKALGGELHDKQCAVGSVKSNIGHLESAAGIAGMTKVILQMQYGMLVPSLHAEKLNTHIDFSTLPFVVQQQLAPWPKNKFPRRAGISSFGAGGANAHLLIEESPSIQIESVEKPYYLLALSGKTRAALQQRLLDLAAWLKVITVKAFPKVTLSAICYTANATREHFDFRCALLITSIDELKSTLDKINQGVLPDNYFVSEGKEFSLLDDKLYDDIHHFDDAEKYKTDLSVLAKLYVNNIDVNWDRVYASEPVQKISLPTYPFARERYWIANAEIAQPKIEFNHDNSISKKVSHFILREIAVLLKLKIDELDVNTSLTQYGMDSIGIINLTNIINQHYKLALTPAILFEHNNLNSFVAFLLETYHEALNAHYAVEVESTSPPKPFSKTTITSSKPIVFAQPANTLTAREDIAVIGISMQAPGANNKEQFWQNLVNGYDGITEAPADRWNWREYERQGEKSNARWGGFCAGIKEFDAAFFNISPREAELMDPQQRILLQNVWHLLEDAGYAPEELTDTGLFIGLTNHDYAEIIHQNHINDGFIATGLTQSITANRISYFLNLRGPSEVIDTACSSSLVAIHHAIQAIRNGDCKVAIAGGVNALLSPTLFIAASKAGMLSEDGHCHTFAKNANGYVRAEGVGSILLKPLSQAIHDGDHIYGVIKGSAVNHGGRVNSLTVPNPNAQAEVIVKAYKQANILPSSVGFIEAHGTGTSLGDPIEINGLKKAFKLLAEEQNIQLKEHYCGVNSVKSSIGHLESAAGIMGIIKVLLSFQNQLLPGMPHFNEVNPFIEIKNSPFEIVYKARPWDRLVDDTGNEIPRRAGVSSFGFGGVNAHIVLEESPASLRTPEGNSKPYYLISLSTKQEESLSLKVRHLYDWLLNHKTKTSLASLSFTLNVGRSHFKHRYAFIVSSMDELILALEDLIANKQPDAMLKSSVVIPNIDSLLFQQAHTACLQTLVNYTQVSTTAYRDQLFILADLYVKYFPIDWHKLYHDERLSRVEALPTYPFITQPYWIEANAPKENSSINNLQIKPKQSFSIAATNDLMPATTEYLQNIFAEKLKLSPNSILVDTTYEGFGVNSLAVLDITQRLEQDFGDLPKTLLYEQTQLLDLATYLIKKYTPVLQRLLNVQTTYILADSVTSNIEVMPQLNNVEIQQDIAIIGLSGKYPMAENVREFWQILENGEDCITEVPRQRWNYEDYPVNINDKDNYYPYGGFITDIDKFDPLFFNISPKDAAIMDPQERLFMQSAWETLEDAGYTRHKIKTRANNNVGVFVGVTYNFYPLFIAEEWQKGNRLPLDIQLFSIANRLSYFLNLTGPSFIVDTACSSSLTAIHLACESIIRGESAMAIAGGVNLSLHPAKYHMLGYYNFMSADGRCTSFGADGTGYVPGEGVGSILLKPLAQAIKDNDQIYAVIKGSHLNHGGKTSGYTVPNPNAQADLIRQTLKQAKIDPRTLSYVEAHGTGTSLGDPIEIRGLQEAFADYTQDKQFCALGSVKSNIGHLESAAGISGLTKVLLQMKHKKIVPSLHSAKLNPFIKFTDSPFYVPQKLQPWTEYADYPRRAGISSFGAGGANAHVIVEEYIQSASNILQVSFPLVFVLSALNDERLIEYAQIMLAYLQKEKIAYSTVAELNHWLANVCYTLQLGREPMPVKYAAIINSYEDLLNKLTNYLQKNSNTDMIKGGDKYAEMVFAWMQGTSIAWDQLYQQEIPRIISLPTYPFAKRHCWVTSAPAEKNVMPANNGHITTLPQQTTLPRQNKMIASDWYYRLQWVEKASNALSSFEDKDKYWLIVGDEKFWIDFKKELPDATVTYYLPGSEDYQIPINLTNKAINIIYIADYVTDMNVNLAELGAKDETATHLYAFLTMIQRCQWQQPVQLTLVTRGAQQVKSTDSVQLWQHYLWSLVRIFVSEQNNYQALLLDVEQIEGNSIQLIMQELRHFNPQDNYVAYRDSNRYVLQLKHNLISELTKEPSWQAPETVIITGGLGALGGEVAKWLVKNGTKNLLLIGATILPDKLEWPTVTDDNLKEKINLVQELTKLGAFIRYASIDVANKMQMITVIQQFEKCCEKSVKGVFHLAGITTNNVPVATMSVELLQQVLRPKVQGALVLHDIFKDKNLDCFVLFSSLSAVPFFGIAGLSAYAMANEFLNGLALYRRGLGLPAIAIDWVAWLEKGMSHKYNHGAFLASVGMSALTIEQGLEILFNIMLVQPTVTSIFKVDWDKFLQVNPSAKRLTLFDDFVDALPEPQPILNTFTEEEVTDVVVDVLAKTLSLEKNEINNDTPLQNYGMDSIIAINFVTAIGKHFPNIVSAMDLYRYSTVSQLSQFIARSVVVSTPTMSAPIKIGDVKDEELIKKIEQELDELDILLREESYDRYAS